MERVFVELYRDGRPAPPSTPGDVLSNDLRNHAMPLLGHRRHCNCQHRLVSVWTCTAAHRVTKSDDPIELAAAELSSAREHDLGLWRRTLLRTRAADVVLSLRPGALKHEVFSRIEQMNRTRYEPCVAALEEPGDLAAEFERSSRTKIVVDGESGLPLPDG